MTLEKTSITNLMELVWKRWRDWSRTLRTCFCTSAWCR